MLPPRPLPRCPGTGIRTKCTGAAAKLVSSTASRSTSDGARWLSAEPRVGVSIDAGSGLGREHSAWHPTVDELFRIGDVGKLLVAFARRWGLVYVEDGVERVHLDGLFSMYFSALVLRCPGATEAFALLLELLDIELRVVGERDGFAELVAERKGDELRILIPARTLELLGYSGGLPLFTDRGTERGARSGRSRTRR